MNQRVQKRSGVSLDSVKPSVCFLAESHDTVYDPVKITKMCILMYFWVTIHTFKNYFAIVFSAINFQFSTNKRYSKTPERNQKVWNLCI